MLKSQVQGFILARRRNITLPPNPEHEKYRKKEWEHADLKEREK